MWSKETIPAIHVRRSIGQFGLTAALRQRSVVVVALERQIHLSSLARETAPSPILPFALGTSTAVLQVRNPAGSFPEADSRSAAEALEDAIGCSTLNNAQEAGFARSQSGLSSV
ncbi:hypothetical protein [Puniceibacterium confluentis]|uniref:hypothetical protein n=1 Tax=Puniceibacterium confluentis TaxID=1958944 RepID=UPI00356416C5